MTVPEPSDTSYLVWLTPLCPHCGEPPIMAMPTQAFCGNDGCLAVAWNPTKSRDDLLAGEQTITTPWDDD